MKKAKGKKNDKEKVRLELLSAPWLYGVGRVLTFGAQKYESHNWRKGLTAERLSGAIFRHFLLDSMGEDLDSETGLHHLLHLACECMFAYEMRLTRPDLDDRYKFPQTLIDEMSKLFEMPKGRK